MIKASSMLLRHIGYQKHADQIELSLEQLAQNRDVVITGHPNGCTAEAFTDHLFNHYLTHYYIIFWLWYLKLLILSTP